MSVLSAPVPRRPAPGFTLIELAIVLAIVAILLRVAAPGLSRTAAARALAAQSSEFMAALRFARAAAMRAVPWPLTSGFGSPTAISTRPTPAATSASQQGGVRPWCAQGSSDT